MLKNRNFALKEFIIKVYLELNRWYYNVMQVIIYFYNPIFKVYIRYIFKLIEHMDLNTL